MVAAWRVGGGGEGPGDEAEMEVVEGNDREGVALRGGAWGEEKGR